jgi:hypothetical protein
MAPKFLPHEPSTEHLRKEAKSILKAHTESNPHVCETLRFLDRFTNNTNESILSATLQLQEVQHALAREYGFKSWATLRRYVEAHELEKSEVERKWAEMQPGQVRPKSLTRFALRSIEPPKGLPNNVAYFDGGVPSAIMQTLRHSGESVDYIDVTATSGWAFSFSYAYDNYHTAALSIGDFDYLPEQLGYRTEVVGCRDKSALWEFVKRHVDAEQPLVCTLLDGGLIYGYREVEGTREMWFDGTVSMGWTDIESPHPMDTCAAFLKIEPSQSEVDIAHTALIRAVECGSDAQAALEAYVADVVNPEKTFTDESGLWFCWAAFERFTARWCCAQWLRRIADTLPDAGNHLLAAAEQYKQAFQLYETYRLAIPAGVPTEVSLHERARTPERIAVVAPILREAIVVEKLGVEEMKRAVVAMA